MDGLRSFLGLAFLVASLLGVACGGTSKRGNGNAGGAGAGTGSGGSTGQKSCVYSGKTYADGATFASSDGCNACSCSNGEVGCDEAACDEGCIYEGEHFEEGESFPAADGCNECSCRKGGAISCTDLACLSCQDTQIIYARALDDARKCAPQSANQCLGKLGENLSCACAVFINQANVDAIAVAKQTAGTYAAGACGGDVPCPSCRTPVSGYCSQIGRCETLWLEGPRACKVGGVVYPDGASGIADPTSCNKCTCNDGELSCTNINCPVPCLADHVFTTQCASCGPVDSCLIVEHVCLPTCSPGPNSCTNCTDGVCRNLCG